MDAKFAERRDELLAECEVDSEVFRQVTPRLTRFLDPFVRAFRRPEPRQHAQIFVSGLMSDLKRKNTESIAGRFGRDRLGLQRFIGWAEWDDAPLRSELARQVGAQIGEDDGVIVFDPSAFPKSGKLSVGVARQWCGRLGKVDNCQVGVYLGYASSQGHTLVDTRLYLPKKWTDDKPRMQQAGVPRDRQTHRTRHELALQMLDENGPLLPHSWITGDDEMGRPYWFRKRLHLQGERYLLAVPSNLLLRDLDSAEPEYSGRGRRPKRPWRKISDIASQQPDDGWTEVKSATPRRGRWWWNCSRGAWWGGRRTARKVTRNAWW